MDEANALLFLYELEETAEEYNIEFKVSALCSNAVTISFIFFKFQLLNSILTLKYDITVLYVRLVYWLIRAALKSNVTSTIIKLLNSLIIIYTSYVFHI
jgi:hypothetical protein